MKRLKKRQGIALLLVFVLIAGAVFFACEMKKPKRYEGEFLDVFDTMTKIVGYARSEKTFRGQVDYLHQELKEYHQLFDIYHDYKGITNMKTINDNAGIAPVKVDPRILDLLEFSRDIYDQTEGNVNVAFGSVLSIWHQYREEGINDPDRAQLPPNDQLQAASKHADIDNMILDRKHQTVYLSDPEMRLDVGAVAKGFAVEAVCRKAQKEQGVTSMLVSVGGNVRAIGYKDGKKEPWKVGVQNPDDSGKMLKTVGIGDCSMVTSGDYQRYYTVDGKNYNHIIDPKTLMPARYYRSVTISCGDSGLADGLSTAAFLLDYESSKALIQSVKGVSALYVMADGTQRSCGEHLF